MYSHFLLFSTYNYFLKISINFPLKELLTCLVVSPNNGPTTLELFWCLLSTRLPAKPVLVPAQIKESSHAPLSVQKCCFFLYKRKFLTHQYSQYIFFYLSFSFLSTEDIEVTGKRESFIWLGVLFWYRATKLSRTETKGNSPPASEASRGVYQKWA